jgi:hypothetical protein
VTEHDIQNEIRVAVSPYCVIFRANVGTVRTPDGRYFSTGLPSGFSDLCGVRRRDGRAVFIEVKKPGGRVSPEQKNFIKVMQSVGAIAGVCFSADEAVKLVTEG